MSIVQKPNGKWSARVATPSARKYSNGQRAYVSSTKTFSTKGAAEAWIKQQREQHGLTGSEGLLNMSEVVEYRKAKKIARGMDLRDVAHYWHERNPDTEEATVAEVVEAYLGSKEWERLAQDSTAPRRKSILNQFCMEFGELPISTVTLEAVEDYLDDIPNVVSRNNHITIVRVFFKWATGRRHRYLTHSPVEALAKEPVEHGTPKFNSLEDVRRLFEKAVETDSGMIPFLALGFFAGIRTDEIRKLEPKDFLISDRRINIRGEVAKRKRLGKPLPRLIEGLPNTLWQWLESVDFTGEIDTRNFQRRRSALYVAAKVQGVHSGGRHTFCTYAYAYLQDAGKVRKWTGHRQNDSVFLTSYAALETEARGEEYFAIVPPTEKLKPTRVKSKFQNRPEWPSDSVLLEMAKTSYKTEIAAKLGVSETAVRKRLKSIQA